MAARMVEYEEDAVIMREGVVDLQMYIVVEGVVALYINYGQPDERVLGVCKANKLFGELGLLTGAPSPYTAVAFTNVKLAYFTKNNLKSFIKGYPDYAIKVLYNIAKLNQILSENLKLALDEVQELKRNSDLSDASVENTEESKRDTSKLVEDLRIMANDRQASAQIFSRFSGSLSQDIAKYLVRGDGSGLNYEFKV